MGGAAAAMTVQAYRANPVHRDELRRWQAASGQGSLAAARPESERFPSGSLLWQLYPPELRQALVTLADFISDRADTVLRGIVGPLVIGGA